MKFLTVNYGLSRSVRGEFLDPSALLLIYDVSRDQLNWEHSGRLAVADPRPVQEDMRPSNLILHPDEIVLLRGKAGELVEKDQPGFQLSYFTRLKLTATDDWMWYSSSLKILARNLQNDVTHILIYSFPMQLDDNVKLKLERLQADQLFMLRHAAEFETLTSREREILRHQAMGKTAQDSADMLFISEQTVKTHRKNIRSKLGSPALPVLFQYARAFDLV
ncbi:response regulator transcription factor [Pedobacter sp. SYP-B3415]|uniref:response regulator transcription factor n=1 Tax=Pedobacter sp. SYP-B3415 TaxID=2496641 RepID=UPI00101C7EFB|nr:helix-turn-helix transcriptional regulator [Pedobacter sp. SYP-B3415]